MILPVLLELDWNEYGLTFGQSLDSAIEKSLNGYFITFISNAWVQETRPSWAMVELRKYLELARKTEAQQPCVMRPIEPPPNTKVVRIPNLKMARGSDVRGQNFWTAADDPSHS